MNFADIINYLTIGTTVAFWVVLAYLLIKFVMGFTHGWRYALYRTLSYAIWIGVLLVCLSPFANLIGNFDVSGFGLPAISFVVNDTTISASWTTPYATLEELIENTLKAFGVNMDPASLANYSLALAQNIVKLALLIVYGVLLLTLINFLVWLFWLILWKHTVKKAGRKKKLKKGRVWNAISALVVGAVCGAMVLFPLTSLVNTVNQNFPRYTEEDTGRVIADDSTYAQVVDILDAYNNSTFAQAYFNWSSNGELTIDATIVDFLIQSGVGDMNVSLMNEIGSMAGIASTVLSTGIDLNSTQGAMIAAVITSKQVPALLSELGRSDLVTLVLPYAFNVAINLDAVADMIKTDAGIDSTSVEWSATLEEMSKIYQAVINSGALEGVTTDASGNLAYTSSTLEGFFSSDGWKTFYTEFKAVIDGLDAQAKNLLDNILDSLAYVSAFKALKDESKPLENKETLVLADFLPAATLNDTNGDGYPDEVTEDFSKAIDWGSELNVLLDFLYNATALDPTFFENLLIDNVLGDETEIDISSIIDLVADHSADVKELIVGSPDSGTTGEVTAEGESSGTETGGETEETETSCLFDSNLVVNGLDKVTYVLGHTVSTSLSGSAEITIDMDPVVDELENEEFEVTRKNYKDEYGSLLDVAVQFLEYEESRALLKDYESHPGLYLREGAFYGMENNLYLALIDAMYEMDGSLIATAILPPVFESFLTGENNFVTQLLGDEALPLNFDVENLGSELASLIEVVRNLDPYIVDLSSMSSGSVDVSLFETLASEMIGDKSVIQYVLDAFADSAILNPVNEETGDENTNYYCLMKTVVESAMGEGSMTLTIADFQEGFDYETENAAVSTALSSILEADLLSLLTGGSSDISAILRSLNELSEEEYATLFGSIGGSMVLRTSCVSLFDEQLIGQMLGEGYDYISFANITDWEEEGRALKAMIRYANEVGDLSNIDFFNSDPESIGGIIEACSQNQLFTDTDGNYRFSEFIADKIVSSLGSAGEAGSYLDGDAWENNAFVYDSTKDTHFGLLESSLKAITKEGWVEESDNLASMIKAIQAMGGLDAMSSIATLDPGKIGDFLSATADLQSFGRLLLTHVYAELLDQLGASGAFEEGTFDNANLDFVYSSDTTREQLQTELDCVEDLMATILDPVHGMVEDGQISASINLASLSGEHFVKPLLTSFAESNVFNAIYVPEGSTVAASELTAFESVVSQLLYKSGAYGSDAEGETTVRDEVDEIVASVKDKTGWTGTGGEIEKIAVLVDSLDDLGFVTETGEIDMSALSDLNAYFSGTEREVNQKKQNLEECLNLMDQSILLRPAMVSQLSSAVASTSVSFGHISDLSKANTAYTNSEGIYGEEEISHLVEILAGSATLSATLDAATIDQAGTLLINMYQSHIFNSLATYVDADGTSRKYTTSLFQDIMAEFLGNENLAEYIYVTESPKVQSVLSQLTSQDAYGYAVYLIGDKLPALDEVGTDEAAGLAIVEKFTGTLKTLTSVLSGSSINIETLTADELDGLLSALNNDDLMFDMVPNLLYRFLTNEQILSIEGVALETANPYFSYYYSADPASEYLIYSSTPNFENRYPQTEIDLLSNLVAMAYENQSLLGDLDIATAPPLELYNMLTQFPQSYLFHLAGPRGEGTPRTTVNVADYLDNLTVFEQLMYNLYSDNGISTADYDVIFDSLYILSLESATGTKMVTLDQLSSITERIGADNKLYDTILSARGSDTSHGYVSSITFYEEEIAALTTSGDGTGRGFIEVWQSSGIAEAMSGESSLYVGDVNDYLDILTPTQIQGFLDAVNHLQLTPGVVAYTAKEFVGTTMGMSSRSVFNTVATMGLNTTDTGEPQTHYYFWDIGEICYVDFELATSATPYSEISIMFEALGRRGHTYTTTIGDLEATFATATTNPVSLNGTTLRIDLRAAGLSAYRLTIDLPDASGVSSIDVTSDSADFFCRDMAYEDFESEYEINKIPLLGDLIESVYITDPATGESHYFNFEDDNGQGLAAAASLPGGTAVILSFIGADEGFYANTIELTYERVDSISARSIVLDNLLTVEGSVTVEGITVPYTVPLATELTPGLEVDSYEYFTELDLLFQAFEANDGYSAEGQWLDYNVFNYVTVKGLYEASSIVSVQLPYLASYVVYSAVTSYQMDALYASTYRLDGDPTYYDYASLIGERLLYGLSNDLLGANADYADGAYSAYSTAKAILDINPFATDDQYKTAYRTSRPGVADSVDASTMPREMPYGGSTTGFATLASSIDFFDGLTYDATTKLPVFNADNFANLTDLFRGFYDLYAATDATSARTLLSDLATAFEALGGTYYNAAVIMASGNAFDNLVTLGLINRTTDTAAYTSPLSTANFLSGLVTAIGA